jgi:BRCT domain type II-containing protein
MMQPKLIRCRQENFAVANGKPFTIGRARMVLTAVVERLERHEAEKDEGALVIRSPSDRGDFVAISDNSPGQPRGRQAH